jgi:hypothetical protein
MNDGYGKRTRDFSVVVRRTSPVGNGHHKYRHRIANQAKNPTCNYTLSAAFSQVSLEM